MVAPAAKKKRKLFHATVQVTRTEEWFVEADDKEQARTRLEDGDGQRAGVGECVNFEIDALLE